jgi:hypothetical protein
VSDYYTEPTDGEREALRGAADRMSPLSEKPYTSLDLALVRDAAYRIADGTFRRQGPVTDAQVEAGALAIARTMGGWNDDTTEPDQDEPMRSHLEAHWEKVNAACLEEGRKHARAALEAALVPDGSKQ